MVTGDGFPYRSHDQVVQLAETAINAIKQRGFIESAEARMSAGAHGRRSGPGAARPRHQGRRAGRHQRRRLPGRDAAAGGSSGRFPDPARGRAAAVRPRHLEDRSPQRQRARVPRAGHHRRTGREHNVQELPRCEGNLVQVLESARKLLGTVIQKSAKLHDLFFREMPEYPTLAWQEALVNAVAHRDYGIQGRSVEVWLFEDRMEVVSPGGLLPEVHLEDLQARRAVHASRNPRLARVLVELDIMREQGEGIPRMFEEMEESWLPMPELVADASSFRVILRNEPIFASSDPDWVRTVQGLHLDARQKRTLIRFVEGDFANGDYQEMNGVDRDQSYRELQQLVELGLLATTGQGKGMRYHVVRAGAARAAATDPLDALKLRMREAGFITNSDYRETFGRLDGKRRGALAAWLVDGTLKVEGKRPERALSGWAEVAPAESRKQAAAENGPGNGPRMALMAPMNGPNGPGLKNV
jgi:ATP-dependent DNA helicase RecG